MDKEHSELAVLIKRYKWLNEDLLRNSEELNDRNKAFDLDNAELKSRIKSLISDKEEVKNRIFYLSILIGENDNSSD